MFLLFQIHNKYFLVPIWIVCIIKEIILFQILYLNTVKTQYCEPANWYSNAAARASKVKVGCCVIHNNKNGDPASRF